MSKTLPGALATHLAGLGITVAWALKVTRADAVVYAVTSHDRDVTLSGQAYLAAPGLSVLNIVGSAGLAVDNTEITILPDDVLVTRADILAGRWNGAVWVLSVYNWASPTDGVEPIGAGTLGEFRPRAAGYTAELRGLQQALQQPVGSVSTQTCRARLGDARCTVALGPFTHAGSVTTATSVRQFTDSATAQADGYYTDGVLTWTSGLNTGLSVKIRSFASKVFTLALPMVYAVQVGDTYSAVAGCRKRLADDCLAKFSNVLNFVGEPHRPTLDDLSSAPEANAS